MVEVYLQEKAKVNSLTFQAITGKDKGKLSPLVEKKEWRTTLISEEMACYLYIDKESINYNFQNLYDYFVRFAREEKIIQVIAEGILFARNLQDAPPNKLHAKEFAETVKEKFSKFENIQVEILDKKSITENRMGLLLAVNAGSHHEPRVVILRYFGAKQNKKNVLGLVGKGITFDSGGYNLKPSSSLQCMKFDMSGAAVVCTSFFTLIQKKPKINVVAVACLTENAIGGHATLTESVVTSMSGKTVEINNTDAEGRLVLADGITYAIEKEKVTKIITVATLTGAVVLALGENLTGIMTNNQEFYQQFIQSTQKSHENI
ncbi:9513_t:CDS:2 [Funneliformis geosporum]|uniref:9513_t:CDS:1 n=1 Tax=Funneliformis geosporum TaxID=1117311 RepID=A0A9W4SYE1_9GLOM|nr:9513_t:CDS:2 [Funneliformis geosporum]